MMRWGNKMAVTLGVGFGHGSGLLTGSRVYLDVLGCLARSFRVLREILLLGESRHFTLSRRGALSVARTAFFAIVTTRTLSDTPGKWPIYGRTWNREPLIRRSPIFRPIIIIILFATATNPCDVLRPSGGG